MSAPTVLVVDDDPGVRRALDRALRLEGFVVRLAEGGDEALAAVGERPPRAIVLDMTMPGTDGLGVIRTLRAQGDTTPICVLSARDGLDDRVEGLQAGADDYLVKPFATPELVARLHALLRRTAPAAVGVLEAGSLRVDRRRHRVWLDGDELALTAREFALLACLTEHAGAVLSRGQLLERVWGYDFAVNTNVVDVFVGYLRRKLEQDGRPRMLRTVRGEGFVLRP
ncbi:response regulator transcription factor [Patulibacter minatonensis]|uniref:response regulator transcription factor n=1 Tax=Patulibacter minatonensis TaxID=298163 RepID=UPI00047EE65D|nr:response regulator transcription factor [Patulibacter minatonensis]